MRKTYVILSGVRYDDEIKQRPHHFANYLAQKGNTVFFNNIFSEFNIVEKQHIKKLFNNNIFNKLFKKETENIYSFNRIGILEGPNKSGFDSVLKRIQDEYGSKNTIFIIQFPDGEKHLSLLDKNSTIIYDCLDDWEHFEKGVDFISRDDVLRSERRLASISSIVVASAKKLYVKMRNYSNNVYYLPNGVSGDDYSRAFEKPLEFKGIAKPIVLFMGAIHEWVDTELMDYIAKMRPEYEFVYIGPIWENSPKRENIQYLGKKPYVELINYVKYAKVGIVPFRLNKLSFCVTPLKLFEYLSAGTPSVSTIFPDLLSLKGNTMCETHDEFLAAVDKYVLMNETERDEISKICIEEVKKYEWEKMLGDLFENIDDIKNGSHSAELSNDLVESYKKFNGDIIKNELLELYNIQKDYDKAYKIGKELIDNGYAIDYHQYLIACYNCGKFEEMRNGLKEAPLSDEKFLVNKKLIENMSKFNLKNEFIYAFLLNMADRCYEALEIVKYLINNEQDENQIFAYALASDIYMKLNEIEESTAIALYIKNELCISLTELYSTDTIFNLAFRLVSRDFENAQGLLLGLFEITDKDLLGRVEYYKKTLFAK